MNDEQRRYCLQQLVELRRSYERDAKPYVDRLIAIESIKIKTQICGLAVNQAPNGLGPNAKVRGA